jgi:tetratricopeptide (TPR) repeat protein
MYQSRPCSSNADYTVSRKPFLTAAVLIALATGLNPAYGAQHLQLKTDDREVYGTREIESGDYVAGIEKLEVALARTVTRYDRAPILNNLCVAYVATRDLETAATFCQKAVDNGYNLDLAYNNRGVMNYVAGNIQASIQDFDLAAKLGLGYGVATRNLALLAD